MRISASAFDQQLKILRELYPEGVAYVSQNLFGSHDANRIGSHIVNRGIGNFRDWGKYFNTSRPQDNPNYSSRKPSIEDLKLQKLFVVFQMTYVGAPMVYYGDEAGMWGGNDPDCRKPMVWDDIEYDDEVYNADGSKHAPDKVEVNKELYGFYKTLIQIRNAHECLQTGSYKTLLADDQKDLFVFERANGDKRLIVVINNSNKERQIDIPELKGKMVKDLIGLKVFNKSAMIVAGGMQGLILEFE